VSIDAVPAAPVDVGAAPSPLLLLPQAAARVATPSEHTVARAFALLFMIAFLLRLTGKKVGHCRLRTSLRRSSDNLEAAAAAHRQAASNRTASVDVTYCFFVASPL
jgi:hypothetical protein